MDGYEQSYVLVSGSYADFRVHCVLQGDHDDVAAVVEQLNAEKPPYVDEYDFEPLPIMEAGRLPRHKTTYHVSVSLYDVRKRIEDSSYQPRAFTNYIWEWEDMPPARENLVGTGGSARASFTGTDAAAVMTAANERLDQLVAAEREGK